MPAPWLDELRFEPGPPYLSMGVRPLDLDRWLLVDDKRDEELALKRSLLTDRHDEVFAALPVADAASDETLGLIRAWLSEHHPELPTAADPTLHPLDAAGRLVQEDLCVVAAEDGYPLIGASLCFPSYWRLADKLGRPLRGIHSPVGHYAEELATKVDVFLDRLTVDHPVWRRNWTVHDVADFFLPEHPGGGDQLWLRSERQTLRRLPATGAVLFTIRTQQASIDEVLRDPERRDQLAATVRSWSPEMLRYKGYHQDALLAAIDAATPR